MAKIQATGTKAITTTAGLGPLEVAAGAGALARRAQLLQFSASISDAPADHTNTIQIQRKTAAGTSSAVTLVMLDQGDTLANIGMVAGSNITVTPTITASTVLYKRAFNSKYGLDYFPAPGCEIMYPATAASGIVWDFPIAPTTGDNVILVATLNEL